MYAYVKACDVTSVAGVRGSKIGFLKMSKLYSVCGSDVILSFPPDESSYTS